MALDRQLLDQVRQIFATLKHNYIIRISCDTSSAAGKEMIEFFTEFAGASEKIGIEIEGINSDRAVATLVRDGVPTGISFRCIPGGHEFTSLLLAVMNADGQGRTLPDEAVQSRIARLKGDISLTTYVSLECTNCPDVVQALNQMALFNDRVTSETVDGNMAVAEAEALGVKSVPTVYANGEQIWVGKGSLGEILDRLEERFGSEEPSAPSEIRRSDLIVIGGGPAGAAAAIYSARKGLDVAVVASSVGGQVKETSGIDNVISVLHTTGEKLASDLRAHMLDYPVRIYDSRTVEEVDLKSEMKRVRVKGGETFEAPEIIIATGARWRRLNVPGENDYIGHGVAFCVHCDGPFFAGKDVAVVGGGNSGVEAAIDLAAICRHVDLFEFLDTLKADTVLQDKLRSLPNVDIHLSSAVEKVTGDGKTPNTEVFGAQIGISPRGEIEVDAMCRTDVPGVYAAGDCTTVPFKQIVIAMGEGAKAALSAFDYRLRNL